MSSTNDLLKEPIVWQETDDVFYPYRAIFNGKKYILRLNDWPDEIMFTLEDAEHNELLNLDGWPDAWKH